MTPGMSIQTICELDFVVTGPKLNLNMILIYPGTNLTFGEIRLRSVSTFSVGRNHGSHTNLFQKIGLCSVSVFLVGRKHTVLTLISFKK